MLIIQFDKCSVIPTTPIIIILDKPSTISITCDFGLYFCLCFATTYFCSTKN